LKEWLQAGPPAVAIAFAARAALRVLPFVQLEKSDKRYMRRLVLPVFRAAAVSWAAAKYPTQSTEFAGYADAAANGAYTAANAAASDDSASSAAHSTASAANTVAQDDNATATASATYEAVKQANWSIFEGAKGAPDDHDEFWSSVSHDATRRESGTRAPGIVDAPLWPHGQPERLQSIWRELKAALHGAKQDWDVWTGWYEDRLAGRAQIQERELAYVRIEEALWDEGPAMVNAEIKRLIEKHEPLNAGGDRAAMTAVVSPGSASTSVAEPTPPRRRKKGLGGRGFQESGMISPVSGSAAAATSSGGRGSRRRLAFDCLSR
jgi:hypothetical protein